MWNKPERLFDVGDPALNLTCLNPCSDNVPKNIDSLDSGVSNALTCLNMPLSHDA